MKYYGTVRHENVAWCDNTRPVPGEAGNDSYDTPTGNRFN